MDSTSATPLEQPLALVSSGSESDTDRIEPTRHLQLPSRDERAVQSPPSGGLDPEVARIRGIFQENKLFILNLNTVRVNGRIYQVEIVLFDDKGNPIYPNTLEEVTNTLFQDEDADSLSDEDAPTVIPPGKHIQALVTTMLSNMSKKDKSEKIKNSSEIYLELNQPQAQDELSSADEAETPSSMNVILGDGTKFQSNGPGSTIFTFQKPIPLGSLSPSPRTSPILSSPQQSLLQAPDSIKTLIEAFQHIYGTLRNIIIRSTGQALDPKGIQTKKQVYQRQLKVERRAQRLERCKRAKEKRASQDEAQTVTARSSRKPPRRHTRKGHGKPKGRSKTRRRAATDASNSDIE